MCNNRWTKHIGNSTAIVIIIVIVIILLLLLLLQPKAIQLCCTPFSVEDDLLTPTFKLKRPQAKVHFKDLIEEMYNNLPV